MAIMHPKYVYHFNSLSEQRLYNALKNKFSDEVLEKAGLIIKGNKGGYIDRFRNRIIIPIQNEEGGYVALELEP